MTKHLALLAASAAALWCGPALEAGAAEPARPLRALYITGGCCHDYNREKVVISEGVKARANVEWTIVQEEGSGEKHKDIQASLYQNPDWAKGYDVVVHNECFAGDTDPEYIGKVLAAHRAGVPAVVVHCEMHTFRDFKPDDFRQFLGVKSTHHGPQHPLDVKVVQPDHPVMKGFPADWKTGNEELYAIDRVFTNTTVLATAADKKKDAEGKWVDTPKQNALIWVNTYGQGRVFGTTLAHANKTFEDPVFLDLFARGLLWACNKLDDSGLPKPGYEAPARK
jgi:type 1 glutamine amidotransferase